MTKNGDLSTATSGFCPRVLLVESNEDGTVGGSHRVLWDTVSRWNHRRVVPIVAFYQGDQYSSRFSEIGVEVAEMRLEFPRFSGQVRTEEP